MDELYVCQGIDDIRCQMHYCYMRLGVVEIPSGYVRIRKKVLGIIPKKN